MHWEYQNFHQARLESNKIQFALPFNFNESFTNNKGIRLRWTVGIMSDMSQLGLLTLSP